MIQSIFSRRNIILGLIILGLAGAGGWYWLAQQAAARRAALAAIRKETVGLGTLQAMVSGTGALEPERQVNLYFPATASGLVTKVNVVLGQVVKPGDVLAELDPADLKLAVQQAQANVRSAELNLEQMQTPPRPADLAVAEANVRVAKNQVYAASQGVTTETVQTAYLNLLLAQNALDQTNRMMDELVRQGKWAEKNQLQAQADAQTEAAQIANLQYQALLNPPNYGPAASAQASVAQAQAALDKLQQGAGAEDLQIAQLQIDQARLALETAERNLADARLVASFAGVVAAVNVRVGEPATSALPAVGLADISHFYLEVAVDEVDVARVQPGQPVTVTLDALPDMQLAASVEKIAPTATVNQGVVSYAVRLQLAPAPAAVRGGMTAMGEIVVAEARGVVLAPNWAIRRDRATGATYVSVWRNERIEEVPVELGLHNEMYSEVTGGLAAGETVAVSTTREQISFFGGGQ